jgi:hypothetical protein
MENGNNSAPAGTADTQADSQVPENLTQAELEDEIGAAFEASLEESEQAEKQPAKPAKDETSESNEEAETEEPEAEEEPEKTEEDEKPPATIKLKDGSEVPLDDLVNGYLRQSDYTRKTQELAQSRQELESNAKKILQQHQEGRAYIDLAIDVLKNHGPKEPDVSLMDTDPIGYMRQDKAFQKAKAALQQLIQGQQGLTKQQQEQQERERQAAIAREQQILFEKVPELSKKETAEVFWQEAIKYGGPAWGLQPQHVANIDNHIAMMVLKDAVASAARPGPSTANARAVKDALQRAREEGTVDAVAATIPDDWIN